MSQDTSAISWLDSAGNLQIRVYSSDGTKVTEMALGSGGWGSGSFSQPGTTVGATTWSDEGGFHIRAYVGSGSVITEHCFDSANSREWYQGDFSINGAAIQGTAATATAWMDGAGQAHVRVYVSNGGIHEFCWDGSPKWVQGAFPG
jgi:hypothetical protein